MSEPMLCPFRKKLKANLEHVDIDLKVDAVRIWDEEFGVCLHEKCAMWREDTSTPNGPLDIITICYCGLAGRP